jgi:CheY-like chemotaxis protein
MSYPDLIRDEIEQDHPALKYINQIEQAAEQMADINQQLLTLGRRGHYKLTTVNLNDVVNQTVSHIANPDSGVQVELDLDRRLMNIKAGSAQIHRAVLNLVTNALDAMTDGGRLKVKTENYYVDSPQGVYARIPRGEYAKLTISDTGDGIPKELLPKVFDPFFTTKQTDKKRGSGLGLSVVHAVVEDHDGYVDYESETEQGTTFYLYFPITRDATTSDEPATLAGKGEKILVVDDDQMQRDVTSRLLTKLGYSVTVVESGEKAVDIIRREQFDLAVLDMIMPPGIDGAETYKRAVALQPKLRAVIISGYAEASRVEEAQGLGAGQFVRKPLTLKTIAVAVRQELDRTT